MRSNDMEPTEALNQASTSARNGFNSSQGRRGEAAVRRAKTHFGLEDPIGRFGLAIRRILRKCERCGVRFKEHAEEANGMEFRLAEDNCLRGLHDRV